MKKILSVKLILSFSLSCLLMLTAPAFTEEEAKDAIRNIVDIPAETMRSVKESVEKFRSALKVELPEQRLAIEFLNPSESPMQETSCHSVVTAYYFFSFSMPEDSIRLAIEDTERINKKCEKQIVLVLRGFIDNSLKATIRKFYSLMKEEKPEGDWPVTIDPPLFDKYNIQEVPTIVLDNGEKTGQIKGLRIEAALKKLTDDLSDLRKYGPTYPIKEKDLREFIASKREEVEKSFQKRLTAVKESTYTLSRYEGRFGQVREDRVYYIDPSVILTDDIRDHQGKVLFPKGSSFNPADYFTLGKYVVLDGRNKKQVEFAVKGEFKKMILISGDLRELARKYQQRFYLANDAIIDRLKIERVPAIIEQEGGLIRVTEKAIDFDEK